jgi:hypothetical protein
VALAEPTSALGLWPQVRDSSIGWPETDEDAVRALAQAWRTGAQTFAGADRFDLAAVAASWPDQAGEAFAGRVRGEINSAAAVSDTMQTLANRCDHFADVVTGAKTSIRTLIETNLDRYAASRSLAVEDRASVQQHFVQFLAGEVNRIVVAAGAQVGGPLASGDPLPPTPEQEMDPLAVAGGYAGDAINGVASLGNAAFNNPLATLSLAGGALLTAGGAVATTAGGVVSLSGAGAAVGVPVAALGAAGVLAGSATVLGSAEALVAAAQNEDRVTPVAGSGQQDLPDRETALADVKERAGIPDDAEPIDEIRNASGVQYVYDVDGEILLVTENTMDRSHPGDPHWEAGRIKENHQVDNHGRWRVQNDKIKINFR